MGFLPWLWPWEMGMIFLLVRNSKNYACCCLKPVVRNWSRCYYRSRLLLPRPVRQSPRPHVLLPNFEGTSWRGGIGGDQGAWMLSFTLPDLHLSLLHQLVPSKLGSRNVTMGLARLASREEGEGRRARSRQRERGRASERASMHEQ